MGAADSEDLRRRFRAWYAAQAQGRDNAIKFEYHLARQLRGIDLADRRVLEVGCGTGAVSLWLALFGGCRSVVALDEAAGEGAPAGVTGALRRARESFGTARLEVVDADIMDCGFADASFDLLIANRAVHHVVGAGFVRRDPAARAGYLATLGELRRLLVPGGTLSLMEISRNSLWRWSPLRLRQANVDWEIHPTLGEWRSVLRESGFLVVQIDPQVPWGLRRFRRALENPAAQFLLGPNFAIRAVRT